MADREKVIKEFELFIKEFHPACTSEGVELDMLREVLAMLKEQEPKYVLVEKRRVLFDDSYDGATYFEDTFYHCPSCNRILSRTHMKKNIHSCEDCGQAVKWDGQED